MPSALIVGAGTGISAAFARRLHREGWSLALASRRAASHHDLAAQTGALSLTGDASDPQTVATWFEQLDDGPGTPDAVLYNPSARQRGPLVELDPNAVAEALRVTAFGAFLVAQQAARRMLPRGTGAILFTGASAGIKGYAQSAPFAMGKFALRGLAQSLARELAPQGLHVAHFVIDGMVADPERPGRAAPADNPDSLLDPDAIAQTYWDVMNQHRSAWSWEVELRPFCERF